MLQRLLTILLSLYIFLIPWQARWVLHAGTLNGGFWEYGAVSIYASDVLFFVIILLWLWSASPTIIQFLIHLISNEPKKKTQSPNDNAYTDSALSVSNSKIAESKAQSLTTNYQLQTTNYKLYSALIVFFIWAAASIAWSTDGGIALFAVLKLLQGMILFLLVTTLPIDRMWLFWALVAAGLVQTAIALVQFGTQSIVSFEFSGIAPKLPSDLGPAVVDAMGGELK